ncbi:26S proteasome regulatory subunit 6A [Tulasnella sp. 417]|nr:26S proteasome regulatory subunit 6A [Tulasnella sp. 417]
MGDVDVDRLPPQTVLARVVRELEDEFTHHKSIYVELAEQYALMDAASNVAKRNVLAEHLREVIDILEQKGDQIASLYDLLAFKDKPVPPRTLGQTKPKDARRRECQRQSTSPFPVPPTTLAMSSQTPSLPPSDPNKPSDGSQAAATQSDTPAPQAMDTTSEEPQEETWDDIPDEVKAAGTDEVMTRMRLIDNDIKVMRSETLRLQHEQAAMKEKVRENAEKIKQNKVLPYLVANVVEILDMDPEAEEDGANQDLDSMRKGKCAVIKTSTRQTIFLPLIGLVPADKLRPGDLIGVNKESYLILDTLPAEYDSRVKAMEVDERPTETYTDIGGLDKQIEELVEAIVLPMKHAEKFKTLGIRPPKGCLMYGPPGTGKTLLARACAAQTNACYLKLAGPSLVQMFIGDGAKLVRDAFELAKEKSPAIIFIDELDAIGTKRFDSDKSGDREVQRTMLELLNQLDGFSSDERIKVIAATNRIDILDPALLRSGRLDRKIEFPLPNESARARILEIHSRKMTLAPGVNFEELARSTDEFNGAQLKAVCVEAGMIALREGASKLNHEHYLSGIAEVQSKKKNTLISIEKAVAILLSDGGEGAETPSFTGSEITLEVQVAALESAIKGLQKQRNARVPIHQLPPELFSTILLYSLPKERVVMRVLELERVSIHWWDHIRGSPQLWAFAEPGRYLALALERSGNTPLKVLHPNQWRSVEEAKEFAFDVGEHEHRWRVLEYAGSHISLFAPYLEDGEYLDIAGGPRLRHLTVHNVNFDLTLIQSSLSNLQTLRITSPPEPDVPWHSLRDVLVLCPRLEELYLAELGINNEEETGWVTDLALPNMRTIDLSYIGNAVLSPFLQAARAPLLEKLFIVASENHNPVVPKLQASNSILGTAIQNNLSKNGVLRVTALNTLFDFELDSQPGKRSGRLRIRSRGAHWREAVGEGSEFHSAIAEHKIPIELRLDGDIVGDYSFLPALPTLVSMTIAETVPLRLVESLFHLLGNGLPGQQEGSQLPCPRLSKLNIKGDHTYYKAASSLIKTRQRLANVGGAFVQGLRIRLSGTEVFAS